MEAGIVCVRLSAWLLSMPSPSAPTDWRGWQTSSQSSIITNCFKHYWRKAYQTSQMIDLPKWVSVSSGLTTFQVGRTAPPTYSAGTLQTWRGQGPDKIYKDKRGCLIGKVIKRGKWGGGVSKPGDQLTPGSCIANQNVCVPKPNRFVLGSWYSWVSTPPLERYRHPKPRSVDELWSCELKQVDFSTLFIYILDTS